MSVKPRNDSPTRHGLANPPTCGLDALIYTRASLLENPAITVLKVSACKRSQLPVQTTPKNKRLPSTHKKHPQWKQEAHSR
ncbi:hypothetical protein TcWFU_007400 [Taenia crassiceps]|uniref:Uncharacterized protein n=1 Tax=Taenia crassiceps TaxID=6207 RepID=A0ABR4QSW7_9CEST